MVEILHAPTGEAMGTASTGFRHAVDTIASVAMILAAGLVTSLAWLSYQRQASVQGHAAPPLPTAPVSVAGAALRGDPSAPAVLIVFSDFQCPFCRAFAQDTFPKLLASYVDPGKLLVAFRMFPLPIHPFSDKAAKAALCAGQQKRFWEMHDELFQSHQLSDALLTASASAIGLDVGAFEKCQADPATEAAVRSDVKLAKDLASNGTPTFFVGLRGAGAVVNVTSRLAGALPYTQFQKVIDKVLSNSSSR